MIYSCINLNPAVPDNPSELWYNCAYYSMVQLRHISSPLFSWTRKNIQNIKNIQFVSRGVWTQDRATGPKSINSRPEKCLCGTEGVTLLLIRRRTRKKTATKVEGETRKRTPFPIRRQTKKEIGLKSRSTLPRTGCLNVRRKSMLY